MDLERLKTFITIIDTGSMSAAAKQLHLTQPALSRAIKSLEQEVGAEIFARQGKGLLLNGAGRALEPEARRLLASSDQLNEKMKRISLRKYFDLRIGAIDSVLSCILPAVLEKIRYHFTDINLKIRSDRSSALCQGVLHFDLDFAIIAHHGSLPKGITGIKIGPYRLHYYGRKDLYPRLADAVTDEDIKLFPTVVLQASTTDSSGVINPASHALTSNMASSKNLIMSGFGVGALVDFMICHSERDNLVKSKKSNSDEDCFLYLIFNSARDSEWLLNLEKVLLAEILSVFKSKSPDT